MTAPPRINWTFHSVLTDAVADLQKHGFDDPTRLQSWLGKLRIAAIAWLPPEEAAMSQIQLALNVAFKRATSKSAILRHHPGISRFTIDRIEPAFRANLQRRILASADLIKLNRAQAVEKTLQRFSGWASSIPEGGSRIVDRLDVKEHIGKPLQQARFEQRRLEIDQGHKLMASISATIAGQTNAIAMVWRSNWRQAGYDYRPDHKERDQKVYAIRGSWALSEGLMKSGADGYLDQITQPAEEPFCRCFGRYLTALRDLPEDMLTEKGRKALAKSIFRK